MRSTQWVASCLVMTLAGVLCGTVGLFAEPGDTVTASSGSSESDQEKDGVKRVSVEVARERAKLAHNIYSATLDVIHHRYFRDDRSTVPARAMEEVFYRLGRQENLNGRWIAVNAPAMSIDHKPQDEFEKQAAKAIASGKPDYERVEDGVYRRAAGISLMNKGCLKCHLQLASVGKVDRFAGLVISIPVVAD